MKPPFVPLVVRDLEKRDPGPKECYLGPGPTAVFSIVIQNGRSFLGPEIGFWASESRGESATASRRWGCTTRAPSSHGRCCI
jgi:hypothetical protein